MTIIKDPPPPTITKTLDYISSEMPIIGEMIPKINSTSDKTNTHKYRHIKNIENQRNCKFSGDQRNSTNAQMKRDMKVSVV